MKKQIKDLSISLTTHPELADITQQYVNILQSNLADHELIAKLIPLILAELAKLKEALTAIRINNLVEEAFELDTVRDDAFVMLRDLIYAYRKSNDESKQEAFLLLWNVIEKLGTTLYDDGYTEQSGKLAALFLEFDKKESVAAMNELNIYPFYEDLKTAEANFTSIYNQKLDKDTQKNYPTIKEARAGLSPMIKDLLPTLRTIVRTADQGAALNWVALINEQTDKVMTQIAARRTRKENSEA